MALNFPSNPSLNQTYSAPNGVDYKWDSVKWVSIGPTNAPGPYVSLSGDTMTGDLVVPSLNGGQLAGFRNKIINGACQIAQRSVQETGVTTAGYYTCDRWNSSVNNLGTWTIDQSTDAPDGFGNSFMITCTAANASPAASAYTRIYHRIEGQNCQDFAYGTASAKVTTLSFWVKSNKTGASSFQIYAPDAASVRLFSTTYTINAANTWEYKTVTIPGDTAGQIDNDNGAGFQMEWWLNSGSSYTGGSTQDWGVTVNANRNPSNLGLGGAVSDYFAITGVQLEVSPVASPYERRLIGTELALCQRYYLKALDRIYLCNYYSSDTARLYNFTGLGMRVIPTFTYASVSNNSGSATVSSLGDGNNFFVSSSTITSGSSACFITDAEFDAEL